MDEGHHRVLKSAQPMDLMSQAGEREIAVRRRESNRWSSRSMPTKSQAASRLSVPVDAYMQK
jgi:hypothetical protein